MQILELTGTDQQLVEAQRAGWSGFHRDERKVKAGERRAILDQTFDQLVLRQINQTHNDPVIVQRISRFVSLSLNAGADITNALAVIYKQGASRLLINAAKSKQRAFSDLYEESRMDTLAAQINRLAFLVGPVLEMPVVRGGRLVRDIFPADRYDIALDREDPLGAPEKVTYTWWDAAPDERGDPIGKVVVLVDKAAFRYYRGVESTTPYKTIPHGVRDRQGNPAFPGTIWRLEHPTDPFDWWLQNRNRRLVDATIEIAFWYTLLNWTRKTQNRFVLSFFGNTDKTPKGQMVDPELPWVVDVDAESGEVKPDFNVQNAQVDPGLFIKHIQFTYRNVIEAYGLPQSAVTFDFQGEGNPATGATITAERLAQLRREQVPYMREAEHSSAWKSVAIAHSMGHPNAAKLPPPDQVFDRFSLGFPEINRVDDPSIKMDVLDWELRKGLISPVDLMKQRHTDLTDDEAEKLQQKKLEEFARFNEFLTTRDLSLSPDVGAAGTAETFGRMGPEARDADDSDDEDDQQQQPGPDGR